MVDYKSVFTKSCIKEKVKLYCDIFVFVIRWLKASLCVCVCMYYVFYVDDLYAGFLLYEICGCFLLNEKDKSIFCIYPRILASLSLATARAF